MIPMRRPEQLFGSFLIIAVLASGVLRPAFACDPNANCRRQECSGEGKCVEAIDQVCEAHRIACLTLPPPSRKPGSSVGNDLASSPSEPRQVTRQGPAASPGPSLIFQSFDPEQKQRFVNLVANEWLVKTASLSRVEAPEKVVQEALTGAADHDLQELQWQ